MIETEERVKAAEVAIGDLVVDDSGDADFVDSTERVGSELVLHNDSGDALIVGPEQLVTVVKP